jgi:L-ascorbate peroxidase
MDGSIVLSKEEAGRPESQGLDALVKQLATAKEAIDKGNAALGSGPISWADTLVLAAKVAIGDEWREIKLARAANPAGGDTIVKAFGAAWDVRLGRLDSSEAAPNRALGPNADTDTMRQFMLKLGAKTGDQGPFAPKPPFWERPAFVVYSAAQDKPSVRYSASCLLLVMQGDQQATARLWHATYILT